MIIHIKSSVRHLPEFFKPLFWSYDFNSLDLERHKKTIIVNTINYGDLKHWKWLSDYYGREAIREILTVIPATALRFQAAKLAQLIFGLEVLNYASRGIN